MFAVAAARGRHRERDHDHLLARQLLEPRHRAAHRSFDLSAGSHARPFKDHTTRRRGGTMAYRRFPS